MLSPARFEEELRRVARFRPGSPIGDPLDAAVKKIEKNPAFTQSRLLTRILAALTYQQGEFRRAEIAALDSETLAMVITLMDAQAAGTSTHEDWVRAVDAAKAAQLGAGG
jgi:histidine ammonia-lyase